MSIRKLVLAAVVSVVLAAAAIALVAVVVQPASPKPTDNQYPVAKVNAPFGTSSGTTPTSTGMVFVASSTASGNFLTELSSRDGKTTHKMQLEGTGATTSIAVSGRQVCVGFDGNDHGGLISCFDTRSKLHTTSWVAPGAVLDLNGRNDSVSFDLLVDEGGQKFAVTVRLEEATNTFAISRHTKLPASAISLVALANGSIFYALGNDGTISSVDATSGKVRFTLQASQGASRLAISNDETRLYTLISGEMSSRVDVIAVVSGKVTSSLKASPDVNWILPTIDNARLVEYAGAQSSGSIEQYRLFN
jgi:hypothetical protein